MAGRCAARDDHRAARDDHGRDGDGPGRSRGRDGAGDAGAQRRPDVGLRGGLRRRRRGGQQRACDGWSRPHCPAARPTAGSAGGVGPTRADAGNPVRGLLPLAGRSWSPGSSPATRGRWTLPPPSEWLAALVRLQRRGRAAAGGDRRRCPPTYAALAVAVLVGVGSRCADRRVAPGRPPAHPALDIVATVPGAALVPLTILLLGITFVANVADRGRWPLMWPVLLNATTPRCARSRPSGWTCRATLGPVRRRPLAQGHPARRWRPTSWWGSGLPRRLSLILTLLVDILGRGRWHRHPAGDPLGRASTRPAPGACCSLVGTIGYLTSRAVAAVEGFVLRHRPAGQAGARRS